MGVSTATAPTAVEQDQNSTRANVRIAALAGAYLWSATLVVASMLYHFPGQRLLSGDIETKGQPTQYLYLVSPAHTLYEHDPAGLVILITALAIALLLATVSLIACLVFHRPGFGALAITAAALLGLFSIFGLLWGILAFAPVVALLVVSARPGRSANAVPSHEPLAVSSTP